MDKEINIFAEMVDGKTLDQFYTAMKQEFSVKGALMPDAHAGYSLPIGAVIATDNFVLPSWVGYDQGCGCCALQTTFQKDDVTANAQNIFNEIYNRVPVGFNVNDKPTSSKLKKEDLTKEAQEIFEIKNGFRALGSLGGGNHFIEIGYDESDAIWIIIHSGVKRCRSWIGNTLYEACLSKWQSK